MGKPVLKTERRHGLPYVWVTWITGLLSGEDMCEWKVWFKSRYKYPKIGDPVSPEWKANHSAMVRARADILRAEGYDVKVEDQNKFKKVGRSAVLSGKPDLIAMKPGRIIVSDEKGGGERRDKYWWQIAIYLRFIRDVIGDIEAGQPEPYITGELVYGDGIDVIPLASIGSAKEMIAQRMLTLGLEMPPARVPSEHECRFCDIPKEDCPVRVSEPDITVIETTEF